MDLITLIIVCVVVGVALWLINAYVPMDYKVKRVMNIAVVVLLVLWIAISVLGVTHLSTVRVG